MAGEWTAPADRAAKTSGQLIVPVVVLLVAWIAAVTASPCTKTHDAGEDQARLWGRRRPGQADVTSSVQTLKLTSVVGPKVVVRATSIASRPLATNTRPIR